MALTRHAYAKINLTLDILGKRQDGFHEVSMVMQTISLHDVLTFERAEGISVQSDNPLLSDDKSNLAWRAADLMMRTYGIGGANIMIEKHIPMAAGLAGGSSDAASVILGMAELYGLDVPQEELADLGGRIGSDVPFCVMGGTMLAYGRGEKLRRLPDMPETWLAIAKPDIDVSTAWAYKNYDEKGTLRHPDNTRMERAIESGNIDDICSLLCNVLENVTMDRYYEVGQYKRCMLEAGASAAMMSGSGPSVFAICDGREQALKVRERVAGLGGASFAVHTVGRIGF